MTRKHTAWLVAALLLAVSTQQAEASAADMDSTAYPEQQIAVTQAAQMEPTAPPPSAPEAAAQPLHGAQATENGMMLPAEAASERDASTEQPVTALEASSATTWTAAPVMAELTENPFVPKTPSMDEDYNTNHVSVQEQIALNLLNEDRTANGLPALDADPILSELARIKANDMRDSRYFAHESPTYGNASAMLKTFGYSFNAVGENIAHHANVTKAQAAFMSSPGHRRNILSQSWEKVGVGVSTDAQGYVYVTQLFVR
ncbi:MAG: CAP domain-containing protein [Aristaeellaceae bacterium]